MKKENAQALVNSVPDALKSAISYFKEDISDNTKDALTTAKIFSQDLK